MSPTSQISIADGGIETALMDRLGQDLPEFAAFVLLDTEAERQALRDYFTPFIELADLAGAPLVLDTPTWRANSDWMRLVGYSDSDVERVNRDAVVFLRELIAAASRSGRVTVNGCVGPRFDDYVAHERMSPDEAQSYHAPQVEALARAGADRVTSVTTIDDAEAIGVVRAAVDARVPVAVSFTVGADGLLPSGSTVFAAITAVDEATDEAPLGFLINCAHPGEVELALRQGSDESSDESAKDRIIGFRLNAARHGDDGPGDAPELFARGLYSLRELAPNAEIFGGCCGTDVPHISQLAGLSG